MLSDSERWLYYQHLGYDTNKIQLLEDIRRNCPARNVAKGGLRNSVCRLASRINGDLRILESHTVEHVCALELEVFEGAIEYYCQPRIHGVEHFRNGHRSVHHATLDFLLLTSDGIKLIECKTAQNAQELAQSDPGKWEQTANGYRHLPTASWGDKHGIATRVWTAPECPGPYLANLQLLFAKCGQPLSPSQERAAERLKKELSQRPISIGDAISECRGLTIETICTLLTRKSIFGTLRSRTLDNLEGFLLFEGAAQAQSVDVELLGDLASSLKGSLDHPLALASTIDYNRAIARLKRVERMRCGEEAITRRFKPLIGAVEQAERNGTSPLAACLTNFANCGNRESRLDLHQEEALRHVLHSKWSHPDPTLRGAHYTKGDLYADVEQECKKRGTVGVSQTTIRRRIIRLPRESRSLAVGGKKAFHADEAPTDPKLASLGPLAPWLTVHIDSTKWDQRLRKDVIDALPWECPTTYVALNGNGDPIARTIMFGYSCRGYLGVLMRDMVARHGCLPRYILTDGGSEYNGDWFIEFCLAYGISAIKIPGADPAKNSAAENGHGRLGSMLAHRLLGSTLPDQKGSTRGQSLQELPERMHVVLGRS